MHSFFLSVSREKRNSNSVLSVHQCSVCCLAHVVAATYTQTSHITHVHTTLTILFFTVTASRLFYIKSMCMYPDGRKWVCCDFGFGCFVIEMEMLKQSSWNRCSQQNTYKSIAWWIVGNREPWTDADIHVYYFHPLDVCKRKYNNERLTHEYKHEFGEGSSQLMKRAKFKKKRVQISPIFFWFHRCDTILGRNYIVFYLKWKNENSITHTNESIQIKAKNCHQHNTIAYIPGCE